MAATARREVMPDDFAMNVTRDIREVSSGDPNYFYRWFGKDEPESIAEARDKGWKFATNSFRRVEMAVPMAQRDEYRANVEGESRRLLNQRPEESQGDEPEGAPVEGTEGRKVVNTHRMAKAKIMDKFEDAGASEQ